jgi:hypothetical protein
MSTTHTETESYRDKISTVDAQGKRVWIYPKKPKGPFTHAREILAIFLLAFFFSAPFIKIDGHSFLLFDILNRKFIIFGLVFWPQDFHLFVLATLSLVVFVVLFTVVLGRLWCGWACPQTVFMEMVFRKIEYWIEGDARKQIALSKQPWTAQKVFKKTLKHSLFFAISFLIGNTFLAYIIGSEKLLKIISDPPSSALMGVYRVCFLTRIQSLLPMILSEGSNGENCQKIRKGKALEIVLIVTNASKCAQPELIFETGRSWSVLIVPPASMHATQ